MMQSVICDTISKSYASHQALKDISLSVEAGELFGLIGPDGAGKTTLFRILTTLLKPQSGKAKVMGYDVVDDYWEIRKRVGYMPGRFSLYQDLTVEENLNFFAKVFKTTLEENYDLVKTIYQQIEPFKKRRAGALSGGMKQKLALSCALIHRPSVLFLDEPTTGVDPVSRKEFWGLLKELQQQGISILVSTPYMDEAGLCDRMALMMDSEILRIASPAELVKQYDKSVFAVSSHQMQVLLDDIRTFPGIISCFSFGDVHHATSFPGSIQPSVLQKFLEDKGHKNIDIHLIQPSVEDCFMDLGISKLQQAHA